MVLPKFEGDRETGNTNYTRSMRPTTLRDADNNAIRLSPIAVAVTVDKLCGQPLTQPEVSIFSTPVMK